MYNKAVTNGKGVFNRLDSNAIIDFCNGKLPVAGRELLFSINHPQMSVITYMELFGSNNIDKKEEKMLSDFVSITSIHPVDIRIAHKTIEIRKKLRMKLPDAIIAATAMVFDCKLITRNTSDFKGIAGLKLVNPWEIG